MGRELRRKEERKNRKNVVYQKEELDTSINKITVLKVVGAVALVLLVLYYILAVFVTKEIDISNGSSESNSNAASDTSSVANRILAGNIFNQKEESYYVYFYDFGDEDDGIASAVGNRSDLKIYRVDTSSSLNSKYVTEETGNREVTSVDDLRVQDPTLVKVEADRIVEYYEGSSAIIEFLNS